VVTLTTDGDSYEITSNGTTTTNRIEVASGISVNITLNNVSIDVSTISDAAAFYNNANVTMTLQGVNTLKSGDHRAGIATESGSLLTIYGPGTLNVHGGLNGAGIGGSDIALYDPHCEYITINSGTINAEGGANGAGIGGGNGGICFSDVINITGGTVTAKGGTNGAGIGSGNNGYSNSYFATINGGTITATGGTDAAGIGGGNGSYSGSITIDGGSVKRTGVTALEAYTHKNYGYDVYLVTMTVAELNAQVTAGIIGDVWCDVTPDAYNAYMASMTSIPMPPANCISGCPKGQAYTQA
jgi:hypothetical protein